LPGLLPHRHAGDGALWTDLVPLIMAYAFGGRNTHQDNRPIKRLVRQHTPVMRALLISLVLASAPAFAQGTWRLTAETDAMTDRVKRSATTVNEQGLELSVYRGPKDAAWVLFSLGKSSFDTLSPTRAPIFRVDKLQPHDLDSDRRMSERGLGLDLYRWEPRWINFSIWHGREAEGRSVELKELMSGQSVVFRYYLGTGGYKETSFALVGAAPVIAEALGISEQLKSGSLQRTESMEEALRNAGKGCEQNAVREDFSVCFARAKSCATKADGDVRQFHLCYRP
jgi:hypothetical protein